MPDRVTTTSIARAAELRQRHQLARRRAGRSRRSAARRRSAPAPGRSGVPSLFRLSVPQSTMRDGLREAVPVGHVAREQPLGLARALRAPRRRSGRGTDRSRTGCGRSAARPACAAGRRRARADVAAVQRVQDAGISWSSTAVDRPPARQQRQDGVASRGAACGLAAAPATSASTRRARAGRHAPASAIASSMSMRSSAHAARRPRAGRAGSACTPAPAAARRADAASAMRHCSRRARPARGRARRPGAWISVGERRALGARVRRQRAPAVDRGLQVQQAAVEAGLGDRRREVADQRRGRAPLGDGALGRVVGGVEVDVGQVADQPVRPAGGGQAACLPGMNSSAPWVPKCSTACGAEVLAQPAVEGARRRASARSPSNSSRIGSPS